MKLWPRFDANAPCDIKRRELSRASTFYFSEISLRVGKSCRRSAPLINPALINWQRSSFAFIELNYTNSTLKKSRPERAAWRITLHDGVALSLIAR